MTFLTLSNQFLSTVEPVSRDAGSGTKTSFIWTQKYEFILSHLSSGIIIRRLLTRTCHTSTLPPFYTFFPPILCTRFTLPSLLHVHAILSAIVLLHEHQA